jgi:hypothetical protein
MASSSDNAPPASATGAVLMQSEEMPKDAQKVEELDFNKIKGPVTADDLLQGMRHMGFQASAMAEAIRIINEMVSILLAHPQCIAAFFVCQQPQGQDKQERWLTRKATVFAPPRG